MRDDPARPGAPLRPFAFAPNVEYDAASAHGWDTLNETAFLEALFARLRDLDPARFDRLRFVIFSPGRRRAIPAAATGDPSNKVLLYISDESGDVPTELADRFRAVFKIHQQREPAEANLFPLNLGYVRDVPAAPPTPVLERPVDIFFSGNLSAVRLPLYRAVAPGLRAVPPALLRAVLRTPLRRALPMDFSGTDGRVTRCIRFTSGFKQGMRPADYGAMLGQAKIVLCPRGFLWAETFRHVEAMRAGAIVISEPLPDTHLYRGAPIVIVANWRDGLATARRLAADPAALVDLQARHLAWYDAVLSEDATARAIWRALDTLPPA